MKLGSTETTVSKMSTSVQLMKLSATRKPHALIQSVVISAAAKKASSAMVKAVCPVNVLTRIVRRIKSAYPKQLLIANAKAVSC